MAPKKEQMAGAMHKLTAAIHRNVFTVGLLGGKIAQVTSENAEKKRSERTKERSERTK